MAPAYDINTADSVFASDITRTSVANASNGQAQRLFTSTAMVTTALVTVNTQRARQTALNAFDAFLASEDASRACVDVSIARDESGRTLFLVLDSFAMYLARRSRDGQTALAKNAVSSYFGNAKSHYLDTFHTQRASCERQLAKTAIKLEKHVANNNDSFSN
ncbi:hypothetical protein PybrP1_003889 [[Pythium] brassicae (nom. inval.)]|nr:hypothetical protein PybrP1_003889 [[Pythium] brassicae (nom. inval.)]